MIFLDGYYIIEEACFLDDKFYFEHLIIIDHLVGAKSSETERFNS